MTDGRRLKSKRRTPPELRLFEHGETKAALAAHVPLVFHSEASRAPHLLMRLGPRDLDHGLTAISQGARPTAVVSGLNETEDFTSEIRRACAAAGVDWFCDPQLWKTALNGYRTAPRLQALDYTPGRDADPYTAEEFDDPRLLRQIARGVVGDQFDVGANGALSGTFVVRSATDPWLTVTREMIRLGLAQRDTLGPRPLIAPVALDLSAFCELQAQRDLVRQLTRDRPDGYLVMLSGLHEDSSPERLVAAIRLLLLLQEAGSPVILSRPGALRHLLLAFGVRGIEFGLGRLLRFSIPDYNTKGGPGAAARFELPSLLAALPPSVALRALSTDGLPESECDCPACRACSGRAEAIVSAPAHAAHTICAGAERLDEEPVRDRIAALKRSIGSALWRWQELSVAGVVERSPMYLYRWQLAIELASQQGLLNPRRLAENTGVL